MFSKNIDPLPSPPQKNLSFNNTRLKDLKKKKTWITSRVFFMPDDPSKFQVDIVVTFRW